MLDHIRELFRYQAWADSQILAAVKAHAPSAADEEIRKTLHHIVGVERFFISQIEAGEFDFARWRGEEVPSTIDALEPIFEEAHANGIRCVDALDPAALDRVLDRPPLDKYRPTVRIALTQVVLHSQHHRGQVASRMRVLGGVAPTVDYIVMALKR